MANSRTEGYRYKLYLFAEEGEITDCDRQLSEMIGGYSIVEVYQLTVTKLKLYFSVQKYLTWNRMVWACMVQNINTKSEGYLGILIP